MQILFIGDPHIKLNNIPEIELLYTKLENLCETRNFDIIVIAGDILDDHEKLWTEALNKAYDFVDMLRNFAPTYVLVGNHDYTSNTQFLTDKHWMNALKEWANVIIVDTVISRTINSNLLVFVPYVSPGRFQEALDTIKDDWKNASCIFAHQEFYGCKMGAITSVEGDKWDINYPFVISGHIHSKQKPQENIYYPGSALQIAFGESELNIIPILTLNNNHKMPEIEEINLELPRKKIIYTDIDKIDTLNIDTSVDKIKVTIKGNQDDFKAFKKGKKYKEILKKGAKVVFKPDKKLNPVKHIDNIEGKNFQSLLKSLVDKEQDKYLTEIYDLLILKNSI